MRSCCVPQRDFRFSQSLCRYPEPDRRVYPRLRGQLFAEPLRQDGRARFGQQLRLTPHQREVARRQTIWA